MVLSTGGPVLTVVLDDPRRCPGIISVRALDLAWPEMGLLLAVRWGLCWTSMRPILHLELLT
jgi:hypothetical protein